MSDPLATLKLRIESVLPATTNPTQVTVFREWLALVDEASLEVATLRTINDTLSRRDLGRAT